ncbi:hypothetical protein ACJX0J_018441, partial [Zea mays]
YFAFWQPYLLVNTLQEAPLQLFHQFDEFGARSEMEAERHLYKGYLAILALLGALSKHIIWSAIILRYWVTDGHADQMLTSIVTTCTTKNLFSFNLAVYSATG